MYGHSFWPNSIHSIARPGDDHLHVSMNAWKSVRYYLIVMIILHILTRKIVRLWVRTKSIRHSRIVSCEADEVRLHLEHSNPVLGAPVQRLDYKVLQLKTVHASEVLILLFQAVVC